jgi:hypothetical protein
VVNECNKISSDQPDDGERTGVCFKPNLDAAVRLRGVYCIRLKYFLAICLFRGVHGFE